jgi:hypothetical protein
VWGRHASASALDCAADACACVCVRMCMWMCVCVRAWVRECVRACVRAWQCHSPEAQVGRQIVGASKFRAASAEIADKIRRLVEVLQSGLQVREYPYSVPGLGRYALEYPVSSP